MPPPTKRIEVARLFVEWPINLRRYIAIPKIPYGMNLYERQHIFQII